LVRRGVGTLDPDASRSDSALSKPVRGVAFLSCRTERLFALTFLAPTSLETMPPGLDALPGGNTAEWARSGPPRAVARLPTMLLFLPRQSRRQAGLAQGAVKRREAPGRRRGLTGLAEPASFRAPQDDP
jgi:hypothetical protein